MLAPKTLRKFLYGNIFHLLSVKLLDRLLPDDSTFAYKRAERSTIIVINQRHLLRGNSVMPKTALHIVLAFAFVCGSAVGSYPPVILSE